MKRLTVDVTLTSALQEAILGNIAVSDPVPADATQVLFMVCAHEDVSLPQFVNALLELRNQGLIAFHGHDCAVRLPCLTDNGRLHVNELITDALCAMSATGKVAEA